jgi:hypothetical protein
VVNDRRVFERVEGGKDGSTVIIRWKYRKLIYRPLLIVSNERLYRTRKGCLTNGFPFLP